MKKTLISSVVLMGILGAWWVTSSRSPFLATNKAATKTPEEILENDYQKIAVNLKPENIAGEEWVKINTYSLTPVTLVTKESSVRFFKAAQNNLPDLYACLKKDFCGMETRGEDDAYFDDQRTPAHILMNRNLKIMKESLRKDISLKSQVDWELMQELASSDSEMLQVEALDIIREFDSEGMKTDELIKMTEDYKGTAKADALLRIAKRNNPSDKLLVASEIQEVFAMADANTVISVLENLKSMALAQSDLLKVFSNLCRFKESDENGGGNWKMIKYEAGKISTEFEKICQ